MPSGRGGGGGANGGGKSWQRVDIDALSFSLPARDDAVPATSENIDQYGRQRLPRDGAANRSSARRHDGDGAAPAADDEDFDPSYGAPPSWLFGTAPAANLEERLGPYVGYDPSGTVYYGGVGPDALVPDGFASAMSSAADAPTADSLLADQLHGVSTLNPHAAEFVPVAAPLASEPVVRAKANYGKNSKRLRSGKSDAAAVAVAEEASYDNLRDRLTDELSSESYECMICCQPVLRAHHIWSCGQCSAVFHYHSRTALSCITKWAVKGCDDDGLGWRCPGCQTTYTEVPDKYYCFCGKETNPLVPRRGEGTPHACGGACGKHRGKGCPHRCTEQCHPGPCPPCPQTVAVHCDCGAQRQTVRCGTLEAFKCDNVCVRTVSCGAHPCLRACHSGPCSDCTETVEQLCHCGSSRRSVRCTADSRALAARSACYSCGRPCGKRYACGEHTCDRTCHEGDCGTCPRDPQAVTRCACGGRPLCSLPDAPVRRRCTDPIATCGRQCGKELACGPQESRHVCALPCHEGACPPCKRDTPLRCRCAGNTRLVPCVELDEYLGKNEEDADGEPKPVLCERRCKKMKQCKQHRCMQPCCVDTEHICLQVCAKKLSCGQHACEQLCHTGRCPRCLQSSFYELRCHCGRTTTEPPVACGARPPDCKWPCVRRHECDHTVSHHCHSEPQCPPCAVLTTKLCYGEHELRNNIPCYIEGVSCGRACNLPLPCTAHTCQKTCHDGDCFRPPFKCTQQCQAVRELCGHPCNAACHVDAPCPDDRCRTKVGVFCKCGRIKQSAQCHDVDRMHERLKAGERAASGATSTATTSVLTRSSNRTVCLPCDADCAVAQRNAQLASAFGVDPGRSKLQAVYTDFLKEQLKLMPNFVTSVEKAFGQLCIDVERLRLPTKSHTFTPMNRSQRMVVHELACYYQIETSSYDREPQRNIVALAARGKSKPPEPLLSAAERAQQASLRPSSSTGGLRALATGNKVIATRHSQARF